MKITTLILLLALVLSACAVSAQTPVPEVVGAEIDALMEKDHQPGFTDDKVTIILLANHEAVGIHPAADSIAETLLGAGKQ